MSDKRPFEYIKIDDISRYKINKIMQEIEKLNRAIRGGYSIQELQASLDLLDESKREENQRILEDANDFLNEATRIHDLDPDMDFEERDYWSEFLELRDMGDDIEVNLSTSKDTILTLAQLAFKFNKYTKWLCEDVMNLATYTTKDDEEFKSRLKSIYRASTKEDGRRVNVDEELQILIEEIKNGETERRDRRGGSRIVRKNWKVEIKEIAHKYNGIAIRKMYEELVPILNLEDVLYEVKGQLVKQLFRCLVKDNYEKFENWGFSKDDNGRWVFNFEQDGEMRYSFHVPILGKMMNDELIQRLEENALMKYIEKYYNNDGKIIVDKSKYRKNNYDSMPENMRREFIERILTAREEALPILLHNKNITFIEAMLAKTMNESDFDRLRALFSKDQVSILKKIDDLQKYSMEAKRGRNKESKLDNDIQRLSEARTKAEDEVRKQIEERLKKTRRIYVQYGTNLDKSASIYALQKHMLEKFGIEIKVEKPIDAGAIKDLPRGEIAIDAGNLFGNSNFSINYGGTKEVNANVAKAQRSCCGVLSACGIYVPHKIVEYADAVIDDEKMLNSRYGPTVARNLKGKALFDFAETIREDGTYLMDTILTNEELSGEIKIIQGVIAQGMPSPEQQFEKKTGRKFDPKKYEIVWDGVDGEQFGDEAATKFKILKVGLWKDEKVRGKRISRIL